MKRSEAIAQGLSTYLADAPCRAGHVHPRRQTTNGACLECAKAMRAHVKRTSHLSEAGWPSVAGPVHPHHLDIARAVLMVLRCSDRDGDVLALRMLVGSMQATYAERYPHLYVPQC